MSKKSIIILIVIFLVVIVGVFQIFGKSKTPRYETVKVERGNLAQTVDATGKIDSAQNLSLHFEAMGRVSKIYVKEGEEVKTGQWLANLSLTELNSAVAQAEATLNQKLAGATDEQIAVAQKQVDSAQITLDQANKTLQDTMELSQKSLDAKYSYAQSALDDAYIKIYNADSVVTTIQQTYFISNSQESLRIKDEEKYNIEEPMNLAKTYINAAKSSNKQEDVDSAISQMVATLNKVLNSLTVIRDICTKSAYEAIITSADKTSLDNQKAYISTAQTTVSSLQDDIGILKTQNNSNINQAEAAVATAEAALEVQKANYNSLTAEPREVDLAFSRAALDQAIANRNKAIIKAPIDGVVTKIYKKEGESISTAETMVEMLSPHYEIEVDVPETDVVKISNDDEAEITLDALGNDVKFSGKVIMIDLASTEIQDVVYYKVKVTLDDNNDERVKPGMTANILIKTDFRSDILYLPSRGVLTRDGTKYVRVLENGELAEKEVVLGMKGDDGNVEILSGAQEGDEVVLKTLD
ncbi:MAG: efflux RND transporter periplasmic adaptor subunit [Candidatus Paceibacterota bacterium]|jgi:RND family efflux transporter MFP subunit|nr:efflux RND transporter periplasmic adaptor subunit [Candidatus Paceibacterota bacterium]MDD5555111.1 efflux RND transporter periplasmic adaptor subunit [Candidatus Paceibacterota bacterium]